METVGWCISKSGNKSRAKKTFYFLNKNKYISPWFPNEQDATDWQNKYVFQRQKQNTMTLYEIMKESENDVKSKLEPKIEEIVKEAIAAGKIFGKLIDKFIVPVLEIQGKTKEEFIQFLKENNIEVVDSINESMEKGELPISYSGGIKTCEKCGSKHLTTGIIDKKKGLVPDNWMHKCLDCGYIIPIPPKIKESDTGGMAAFNGPMNSSVLRKQLKTKKKFKKKSTRPDGYSEL
jgi:hypothetical protein